MLLRNLILFSVICCGMHYLIKTVVYSLYNAFTIVHQDIHVYMYIFHENMYTFLSFLVCIR